MLGATEAQNLPLPVNNDKLIVSDAAPGGIIIAGSTLQCGDGSFTGSLDGSKFTFNNNTTLALDLPATTGVKSQFDLNHETLRLRGAGNKYTDTFLNLVATNYDHLQVDKGTTLTVKATIGCAGVGVPNSLWINPLDLVIDLSGIASPTVGDTFTILQAGSGEIYYDDGKTAWQMSDAPAPNEELFEGLTLYYRYFNGALTGEILHTYVAPTTGQTAAVTNPEALLELLNPANLQDPSTPTGKLQQMLQSKYPSGEMSLIEADKYVQQFTQSMASASIAQVQSVNTQILQSVASQIVAPWASQGEMLRGQNLALRFGVNGMRTEKTNAWFQSLGYLGEQRMKDYFAPYDTSGWGFALGADRAFGDMLLGLSFGHTGNELTSHAWLGTSNPNKVNVDTNTFLIYGLTRLGKKGFVSGNLGCTWGDYAGSRLPINGYAATWENSSRTMMLQTTLGYSLIKGGRLSVTPKFKFGYFNYDQLAYREQWSDGSEAAIDAYANGYCEYDLLIDFAASMGNSTTLTGSFGYRCVDGADGAALNVNFGGLGYQVQGISSAKNVVVLDLGVDTLITKRMSLLAEYNLRSGDGSTLHGGTGTVVWRF